MASKLSSSWSSVYPNLKCPQAPHYFSWATKYGSHIQPLQSSYMLFNWAQSSFPCSKSSPICPTVTLNIPSAFPTALRSSQAKPRILHYSLNIPTCFSVSKPLLKFWFSHNFNRPRFELKTSLKDLCQVLPLSQEFLTTILNSCCNRTLIEIYRKYVLLCIIGTSISLNLPTQWKAFMYSSTLYALRQQTEIYSTS